MRYYRKKTTSYRRRRPFKRTIWNKKTYPRTPRRRYFPGSITKSFATKVRRVLFRASESKYFDITAEAQLTTPNIDATNMYYRQLPLVDDIEIGPDKNNMIGDSIYVTKIIIKLNAKLAFVDPGATPAITNSGPLQYGVFFYKPRAGGINDPWPGDGIRPHKFLDRESTVYFVDKWYEIPISRTYDATFGVVNSNSLGLKRFVVNVNKKWTREGGTEWDDKYFFRIFHTNTDPNLILDFDISYRIYYKDV